MAKTLKQIINKEFVPLGTEDDKLFKATNMKSGNRPADYKPGEDKKAYEKAQKLSRRYPYDDDQPDAKATVKEAIGASMDDRKHALYLTKLSKTDSHFKDTITDRSNNYKKRSDEAKKDQHDAAKGMERSVERGKKIRKSSKDLMKNSAERQRYNDNQHSLYKNALKVVHKEETELEEKVTHTQKYAKTEGDKSVSRYEVRKDGKKVGYVKHTSKGESHEKMAFFPLGASKAQAYATNRLPGANHKEKIAHMIKMHVKEELDNSIEMIMEKYKIGDRRSTKDPYTNKPNINKPIKTKK